MGQPFQASTSRPAYVAMSHALEQAYGRPTTTAGVGGSIPLCNVLNQTFPDAEIILTGAEEPKCQMHAPNESVDPAEIERLALAEALFIANYPAKQLSACRTAHDPEATAPSPAPVPGRWCTTMHAITTAAAPMASAMYGNAL